MKKNSTKGYIILGILFLLVSITAFVLPIVRGTAFWIAYVFTVIAFLVQIGVWKVNLGKEDMLKSKFLGFPVVHVGIVYLVVQTIAFAVFMFAPQLPTWSAIVVCSCIAGVSAMCMIAGEAGKGEIERIDTKVQKKVFYLKELQANVEIIAAEEMDEANKAALLQLAERIRFSDPMSNVQLADLEVAISNGIDSLKGATDKLTLITEITKLLNERNQKCKILK